MNVIISIILVVFIVFYELYDLFRKKYEVFGIIIDKKRGATGVDIKYFRKYKDAMKCYKEYKNKYFNVCMNEL